MRRTIFLWSLWLTLCSAGSFRGSDPASNASFNPSALAKIEDPEATLEEGALQVHASNGTVTDCGDFNNVVVKGSDITSVMKSVCKFWPGQFGDFPIDFANSTSNFVSQIFEDGGIYDTLKNFYTKSISVYCYRRQVQRIGPLEVESSSCPETLNNELLEELELDESPKFAEGYWSCAEEQNSCNCTRRDQVNTVVRASGWMAKRPEGCNMVHRGECYGDCPRAYRPTFFIGHFRPVCTSICGQTDMPFTCGVGCANSRWNCILVILGQIKEIAIATSMVIGFLTGSFAVAAVVAQVVRVAEFVMNIIPKIVEIAEKVFRIVKREKGLLSLVIAVFSLMKIEAGSLGQSAAEFSKTMGGSTPWFVEIMDAEFGWSSISLPWIAGLVTKYGVGILGQVFSIADAFKFAKCSPSDDDVGFVVEEVGDERLMGAWSHDGYHDDKPRYRLIANRENVMLEWDSGPDSWSTWVMDRSFGRGWWLGWLGFGWRELYESKAQTAECPTTGWETYEGAHPPPSFINALNGGLATPIETEVPTEL